MQTIKNSLKKPFKAEDMGSHGLSGRRELAGKNLL